MKRFLDFRGVLVVALLAGAGYFAFRQFGGPAPGANGFFYDLSAGRIFTGPRDALPPIRGVDGPEEDGFRALVISTNGKPSDRRTWQVAYLEKFAPELKQKMVFARDSGAALAMGRLEAAAQRFVRRLDQTDWHPMTTDEGDAIVSGWARPGPDGVTPVVCAP